MTDAATAITSTVGNGVSGVLDIAGGVVGVLGRGVGDVCFVRILCLLFLFHASVSVAVRRRCLCVCGCLPCVQCAASVTTGVVTGSAKEKT